MNSSCHHFIALRNTSINTLGKNGLRYSAAEGKHGEAPVRQLLHPQIIELLRVLPEAYAGLNITTVSTTRLESNSNPGFGNSTVLRMKARVGTFLAH